MYKQIKEEDQQQMPVQTNFSTSNENGDEHANDSRKSSSSSNTKGSGNFIQLYDRFTFNNINNNSHNNNNNNKQSYRIYVELSKNGIHMRHGTIQTIEQQNSEKHIKYNKNLEIIEDEKEQILNYADIVGVRCSKEQLSLHYIKGGDGRVSGTAENVLNVCRHNSVAEEKPYDGDITAYMYVCAYVKYQQPVRRERIEYVFYINNASTKDLNMRTAESWQQAIMHNKRIKCADESTAQLPLLILLNPKSGAGKARDLFQNHMLPVLCDANMPYELQITTRANYAREMLRMRTDVLEEYRGVVVASGDGLFFEVLNGIMARNDWKNVCARLPLGIVPCGSGNGLASSIAHFYNEPLDTKSATLNCLSGQTTPMDIVRVEMKNQEVIYSFLSLGWGIIADIDIESETLRSIGALRFTLWTIHRMIRLRTYKGRVSYLPFCKQNQNQQNNNNTNQNNDLDALQNNPPHAPPSQNHLPPLSEPLTYSENGWQSVLDDFVLVHAAYTTHLSADAYFLPQSGFNDGIIYLVLIRAGISRKELFKMFLRLSSGTHFPEEQQENAKGEQPQHKYISVIPVTAFRLEPLCNEGIIAVDGERVPYGPIQAEILPGAIKVMVPHESPSASLPK